MTLPARFLLLLLASVSFLGLFLPSEPMLFLVVVGALYLGGGWARCLWWAHGLSRRRVAARRIVVRASAGPGAVVVSPGEEVEIAIEFEAALPPLGAFLRVDEVLPPGVRVVRGAPGAEGRPPLSVAYRVAFDRAGRFLLPGVLVRFADAAGLFTHESFHALPLEVEVLPLWMTSTRILPATKIDNRLLPLGVHRHPRRGVGAELLELRDYVPGDPPRAIAWKASARRDRLITRDFESEVTIRTRLFLDVSDSMRLGPAGRTALDRAAGILAGLVAVLSDARDPVGLTLFDPERARTIPPRVGSGHLTELVRALADVSGRPPESTAVDLALPFEAAWRYAQIVYADELDPAINRDPRGLLLPFLGRPAGRVTLRDRLRAVFAPGPLVASIRRRKRLATLLVARNGAGPGAVERLRHDDAALAREVLAFAAEHGLRLPYSVLDEAGRWAFHAPEKIDRLADAMAEALHRARDQELYVAIADLTGLEDRLDGLVDVLAQAKARNHRVLCFAPIDPPAGAGATELAAFYDEVLAENHERARDALARAGVPLLPLVEGDTARTILTWIARLRQRRGVRT